MKIIVAGAGSVGKKLVEQLSKEDHDIVVVDQNSDLIKSITTSYDVLGVEGNCVGKDTLQNAGVKYADLLIACTLYDEMNILCCMVAKKLGVRETIARVRNPEYFTLFKDVELGLSMLVNPEYEVAMEVSRLLRYPYAKRIEPFANGNVDLVEFKVANGSKLHGMQLKDLPKQLEIHVLLCFVQRNGQSYIPTGDFVLQADDDIYVTASPDDLAQLFKFMGYPKRAKKVLITGTGRISYYLTDELINKSRKGSHVVTILGDDEDACKKLRDQFPDKVEILHGDTTDQDVLIDEGLENTDAFVTLTDSDETNVITSLFATKQGVKKVITKVDKVGYSSMLEGRGSESIVSICNSTVNEILRYVRSQSNTGASSVRKIYKLANGKAELLEFVASRGFGGINIPLRDLNIKPDVLISAIVRDGQMLVPGGGDVVKVGDTVLVATLLESISDLADILG